MTVADDNFESAIALLKWAQTDAGRLHRSVEKFFSGKPCIEVTELNPKTGNFVHKLKIIRQPPNTWRRLTFRIVCDLRHCIDQAMYAAVHTVLGSPPSDDIYFPWSKTPTDLTHRRKKIPQVLWPVLDRLEPYRASDAYTGGDDTVFAIRNAAGPNKHRIAIEPQARPTSFSFRGTADGDWRIPYDGWDRTNREFIIIDNLPEGGQRDYTVQFFVTIAFGDVEGLSGKPVMPVLHHFGAYAAFVINELLEESRTIAGI